MRLIGNNMNPNKFRWLVAGLATLVLGAGSTFIWAAVQGGLGLIVIGLLWAIGMGLFNLIPYLAQRLENKILAMRKEEARRNKLEQLQNHYTRKLKFVENFKTMLVQFKGQVDTLQTEVANNLKECSTYDPTERNKKIAIMDKKYLFLKDVLKREEENNIALKYKIKDAEFDVKSSKALESALSALDLATGTSSDSVVDNMLADEAFNSAALDFNTIFAQLELEAEKAIDFSVTDEYGTALKQVGAEA